jgi:hypothetical protein
MRKVNKLVCLLTFFIIGCRNDNEAKTEKFQNNRDEIIDVKEMITDIKTETLFGNSDLYIANDFLIVQEIKPGGSKGIHLFNKNTFEYITSTGVMGHGPGELVRPGRIGVDIENRVLWVPDHGKKIMLKFPVDSILNNEMFKPTEGLELHDEIFIERFGFLNDSIALGKAVQILTSNSFAMTMARLNLNTNKTEKFGYDHPEAVGKKSNSMFALSVKNDLYVNGYFFCDLMTICDLKGNLKYNIYGPDELENKNFKKTYFTGVKFIGNTIIASYIGDVGIVVNEFKRQTGNLPSKFLIFDTEGNYKNTIDTGYKFSYFCVDESNNRVIAYFADRDNPLAYFNLNPDLIK